MDPILSLLAEPIEYKRVEEASKSFGQRQAGDILIACRLLNQLDLYLKETDSWSFSLLYSYDFEADNAQGVSQFELDVAIVAGNRAKVILKKLKSWDIVLLKSKVSSQASFSSDAGTILTTVVMRVISRYNELEIKLQLVLSRCTLLKIHYELTALFDCLPQKPAGRNPSAPHYKSPLAAKYKSFVAQLLNDMKATPFDSVQHELFHIVRDLNTMFHKFKDSELNHSCRQDVDLVMRDQIPEIPDCSTHSQFDLSPSVSSETCFDTASVATTVTSRASSNAASVKEEMPSLLQAFRPKSLPHARSNPSLPVSPTTSQSSAPTYEPRVSDVTCHTSTPPRTVPSTLEVARISDRMMVRVDGAFVDMQEWLTMQNNDAYRKASMGRREHLPRPPVRPQCSIKSTARKPAATSKPSAPSGSASTANPGSVSTIASANPGSVSTMASANPGFATTIASANPGSATTIASANPPSEPPLPAKSSSWMNGWLQPVSNFDDNYTKAMMFD